MKALLSFHFILLLFVAMSGCSIVADPDAFTYIEGSATDDRASEGTAPEEDTTTIPGSDSLESDPSGESESESESESSDDTGATQTGCKADADCPDGFGCPVLFDNDLFEEEQSRCYEDCRTNAEICKGTPNPLCYRFASGAVCLNRTVVRGNFACRLIAPTTGNQIDLRVRPEDDWLRLERCEMFSDDDGFGFIFSTVEGESIIEAGFYIPGIRLGDLQTGLLETATGEVFRKVLDENSTPVESSLLGFFPNTDMEQEPTLTRDIDIQEITAAGPVRGEIRFDGFSYDAKMRL